MGYEAWNVANSTAITRADIEQAAPLVQRKLDESFFLVRIDRVTPAEKNYLHAMATLGPGPHRSGDIAAQLGVQVETVAPRRSALIRKGMIYGPAHGDTTFTVPEMLGDVIDGDVNQLRNCPTESSPRRASA